MADMTQSQITLLFQQGVIIDWRIEYQLISRDWLLSFQVGSSRSYLLDVRRKERKVFKSLDAAASALRSIGFDMQIIKSC